MNRNNPLIKKALTAKVKEPKKGVEITKDVLELVESTLKGEISYSQAAFAMGMNKNSMYSRLFAVVRAGVASGKLKFQY